MAVFMIMIRFPAFSAAHGQQLDAGHLGKGNNHGVAWQAGQGLYQEGFHITSSPENCVRFLQFSSRTGFQAIGMRRCIAIHDQQGFGDTLHDASDKRVQRLYRDNDQWPGFPFGGIGRRKTEHDQHCQKKGLDFDCFKKHAASPSMP